LQDVEKITDNLYKNKDDILVARLYREMSMILRRMSKFQEALEYIEKSTSMKQRIYGEYHPSVGDALEVKAKLKVQLHQLKDAKKVLINLLIIRRRRYGWKSHFFARSLHEFGCLYTLFPDDKKALPIFLKTYKIYNEIYGESHPELGKLYMDMGMAYIGLKEYSFAQQSYENAMKINSQYYNEKHPYIARVTMEMGILFLAIGNDNEALNYLEESHKFFSENTGQNYPDLARNLKFLGDFYKQLKLSDKALDYYKKALDIKKMIYSATHPEVIELQKELLTINEEHNS
jgi:tetratricopeptide (TPR) repeat protein